jgi:MFS family permease
MTVSPGSEAGAGRRLSQRGYVMLLLTALSAMNQLDRQIMNILIEPVRREFGLSDVQLGLLAGLAFVALYSVLSVPAALHAMRYNRRNLLAASAALWGLMTVLCGFAQNYWHLLVTRLGVGVGEAGGMPPSHAIISDLYPPEQRATAMATWSAGINIGVFLAYLVGGYVGYRYGWRVAFYVAGGVTVLLALVLRFSVREPVRTVPIPRTTDGAAIRALTAMWSDPVLRQLCLGATITTVVGYAALAWIPSYLVRSHDFNIAQAGAYLAFVAGIGGAIGTWLGGKLSDILRRRDVRWSLWLVAVIFAISKPLSIGFLTVDTTWLALALFILPGMFGTMFLGPSVAVLHNRVAPELRPVASAMFLMLVNLIGLGLGPLLVGAMSQWVFAAHGQDSLRYALVVMQMVGFWGAAHYYLAGRALRSVVPG